MGFCYHTVVLYMIAVRQVRAGEWVSDKGWVRGGEWIREGSRKESEGSQVVPEKK